VDSATVEGGKLESLYLTCCRKRKPKVQKTDPYSILLKRGVATKVIIGLENSSRAWRGDPKKR
jgi:hypothetical protein